MKKTILKTIYNLGGFAPFQWTVRDKILILTYHRFSLERETSKTSAEDFENHLGYLKEHARVLPLSETVEFLRAGKTLPPHTVVITIDDGYGDAYEIAFPILKKYNLPATIFVITDFLDAKIWLWTDKMRYVLSNTESGAVNISFDGADKIETVLSDKLQRSNTASRINSRLKKMPNAQKELKIAEIAKALNVEIPALPPDDFAPLNWSRAREMDAGGISVESHTVTHPILTNIEDEQLDFEMRNSKARLEEILDREVGHFCYPNGAFNENVRRAAENAGYRSAVTTKYGFNNHQSNKFTLNRIDAQPAIENFAQSVSGFEALKQKITI